MNILKTWYMSEFSGAEGDKELLTEAQRFFVELKESSAAFSEYIQGMVKARQTKDKASSISEALAFAHISFTCSCLFDHALFAISTQR